ncbi:MAG TPA: integrating conjugative element protein [Noviherbaspirillum sp.]
MKHLIAPLFAIAIIVVCGTACAVDAVNTQSSAIQIGSRPSASTNGVAGQTSSAQADATEQLQAQFWGLTLEEVRRANLLMKGPRGAFSAPNITPVEVLGIHARNDAERQKYAEQFARILRADTERVLAWSVAHAQAMARLYPNDPVIDFSGNRIRPMVDPSVAEAALVPKSAVTPAPRTSRRANSRTSPRN